MVGLPVLWRWNVVYLYNTFYSCQVVDRPACSYNDSMTYNVHGEIVDKKWERVFPGSSSLNLLRGLLFLVTDLEFGEDLVV